MFVDKVDVHLKAGDGGDGRMSFRKEKFVARGGPDGGDGGTGGNIIALASNNQNTLATYRYRKIIAAEAGQDGDRRKKRGKKGEDLILKLPVGTVITSSDGSVLADLVEENQTALIAQGGGGGYGNAHFISSTRQAPKVAEKGEPGEEFDATFELKMIADVGLVGLPNAGKSTLLSTLSNAHPEIADYPFTTLKPNLGVVDIDKKTSLLLADIPGLIKGASKGKGLGDEFLRHVERTKVLVHLIDAYQNDIVDAYQTINKELADYSRDLARKPQVVAINKIEGLDKEILKLQRSTLRKKLKKGTQVMEISAKTGEGTDELLYKIKSTLDQSKPKEKALIKDKLPVITLKPTGNKWTIKKKKDFYHVSGPKIERFAVRTDFENEYGVNRLKDIMRKMGIMHELERKKINPGDKIQFGDDSRQTIEY